MLFHLRRPHVILMKDTFCNKPSALRVQCTMVFHESSPDFPVTGLCLQQSEKKNPEKSSMTCRNVSIKLNKILAC